MRTTWTWLLVAFSSGIAAAAARVPLEPEATAVGAVRDPAWLPRGEQLRVVSLGQRLVVSDLYWLKLVQYVGENFMGRGTRWDALYPLADLVTDLDPRHGYAYQIAGSNLAGLAKRYGEADRILEKGMRNVPARWELPFMMAVNKFLYEGDFQTAAAQARRAAEVGHRPHLALLAANLSLVTDQDEEYRAAEQFLLESLKQVDTPQLGDELRQRLVKVRTYALLSRLERALARLDAEGRHPRTLAELAEASGLPAVPPDPAGGRIEFDPSAGTVRSSVLGKREPIRVTP